MKVLLTGGSGFLGSFVAEQLSAEGHVVRALVRPHSARKILDKVARVEFAPGAIEDRASLGAAVDGVDAVVHVAGIVKARRPADFFEVNTQGTKNLLEAAVRHGVGRFVYVSSLAAVGPSMDGTPVPDEAEPKPVTHYGRSKLEAERAVLAAKDRLHVTVVRPPLIYGPRDRETLAFFTSVRNGVLPMTGDGSNTLSVVYVADCASAVVRALGARGVPSGRTYFVDDGTVYVWRGALAGIESALGRRALVRFGMPLGGVKGAAAATQLLGKMSNTAQKLPLHQGHELNPPARVWPGAVAPGQALFESMAIVEYLDETYPEPPLLPKDSLARARVRAIAQLMACDIHPLNNLRVLRYLARELKADDSARDRWYAHWIHEGFRGVETALPPSGSFCHGTAPTVADVFLVPQVANAIRYKVDLGQYPRVRRIYDECMKVDAFAKAHPDRRSKA